MILIEGGELYAPERRGRQSILTAGEKILKIGDVDRRALDTLDLEYEVIDATGCCVVPGFIDPHEHLLGSSGEGSLAKQSPMILVHEILRAGITTVVGTLGVDTTMRTMSGLLGRVKALGEDGVTARMWTGGYNVPPTNVLRSPREDIMFIDECIGSGEIAISDERALTVEDPELARVVIDTYLGGMLSGKAGVTHFHVGTGKRRLRPLRDLLDNHEIKPEWLYPTHVSRNEKLLLEAVELAKRGSHVDMDCVEQDLVKWLRKYREAGGPSDKLTISSDADSSTPDILSEQFRTLVSEHGFELSDVLPLITSNTADILSLKSKGRLNEGMDADVVILESGSIEICDVVAKGRRAVRDREVITRPKFYEDSYRSVSIVGDKYGTKNEDAAPRGR
jgi:beta-aspartyl-dipeptidase (metallo-type)